MLHRFFLVAGLLATFSPLAMGAHFPDAPPQGKSKHAPPRPKPTPGPREGSEDD